ncbi:MAG: PorT family protein [Spirochaetes bacterium]|nr:PorT family protein [Spirochaetota bacterium]
MRKIVLLFIIISFSFITVSQVSALTSLWIKGGVNIAKQNDDPEDSNLNQSSRLGAIGGLGLEIGFGGISFDMGALYEQKGEDATYSYLAQNLSTGEIGTVQGEAKIKVDYLTFPLLLKAKIESESIGLYFGAGLGIGVLMSAKLDQKETFGTLEATASTDVKDLVKSSDMGILGVFGFHISSFLVETIVNYGITDINNIEGSTATSKNFSIGILAGFRFDLI